MKKFNLYIFILILNLPLLLNSQVKVLKSDNNSLIVSYTPELTSIEEVKIGDDVYYSPVFKKARNTNFNVGAPQVFEVSEKFNIPSPDGFVVKDIHISTIHAVNKPIAPAIPYDVNENQADLKLSTEQYNFHRLYDWVEVSYAGISRNNYLGEITFRAAQFDPNTSEIKIPSELKVEITFEKNNNQKFSESNSQRKTELISSNLNDNLKEEWSIKPSIKYDSETSFNKLDKNNKVQSEENLSSGTWFKLSIKEEGVYRLTPSYLSSNGISIPEEEINTIKIFGNGGMELPQEPEIGKLNSLNEQAIIVNTNNDGSLKEILFYGAAPNGFSYGKDPIYGDDKYMHYINHYSDENSYLITWGGDDGLRAEPQVFDGVEVENIPTSYMHREYFEEEIINAFYDGSGKQFFGRSFFNEPIDFPLFNVANEGDVLYRLSLAHARGGVNTGYFNASDNGKTIAENIVLSGLGSYVEAKRVIRDYEVPVSELANKNNSSISLSYNNPSSSAAIGYLDYIELHYPRQLIAIDDEVSFLTDIDLSGYTQYNFSGFNGKAYGFDITDISNPKLIENISGSTGFSYITDISEGQPSRFYISSKTKTPVRVSEVEFKDLRNTATEGDVIVITSKSLLESAKKFKEYRESNSDLTISIFTVNNIYNEFNAGTPDITAIRDFISHAFHNWDVQPSYVVLWGDGHYDYRGIVTQKPNYVPPFESDDHFLSFDYTSTTTTDDFYARVSGNDRIIDLAIGRITINSEQEGNWIVEKIKHYEHNSDPGNWRTRLFMVADDGPEARDDTNGPRFVNESEDLIEDRVPEYMQTDKLYSVEYPTEFTAIGRRKPAANVDLVSSINNQSSIILNWYGHGNPGVWSHEAILTKDISIPQMSNLDKLFFLTAATCNFGKFDSFDSQSGSEDMFQSEFGAAIGVFSSARVVFASSNDDINRQFYRKIFEVKEDGSYSTLGEMLYSLKQTFSSSNDEKFFLLGDPTLRLLLPENNIKFTEINGVNPSEVNNLELKGLENITIKGIVTDPVNDNKIEDFNGVVRLDIYDGDVQISARDIYDDVYTFLKYGGALNKSTFEVVNGEFTANLILPKDISFSENNGRMFGFASDNENELFAKGSYTNIIISGIDESSNPDNVGPEIDISLDSRRFNPGDVVREEPLLIVDLFDESGINSTGVGIGHRIEAWVDDNPNSVDLTNRFTTELSDYRKGSAERVLLDLEPGIHTVKVRAWDIYNNFSTAETYFNILSDGEIVIDEVLPVPNPFIEQTEINFKYNMTPPVAVNLGIYNSAGVKVRTINQNITSPLSATIYWDGNDQYGQDLPAGAYYFRIEISSTENGSKFLKGNVIKAK